MSISHGRGKQRNILQKNKGDFDEFGLSSPVVQKLTYPNRASPVVTRLLGSRK